MSPDSWPDQQRMAVTVIDTDELIRRNGTFADGRSFAGLTIRPGGNLRVIGCGLIKVVVPSARVKP